MQNEFFTGQMDQEIINLGIDTYISRYVESAVDAGRDTRRHYSRKDLDEQVNEDETLREYLMDSCRTFNLEIPDLDRICDTELNRLLQKLDARWNQVVSW